MRPCDSGPKAQQVKSLRLATYAVQALTEGTTPSESNKLGVPVPTPPVGLINDAVRRGERAEQGH